MSKGFNLTIALEVIANAPTVEKVEENFDKSCTLCVKGGYCDEGRCPVAKARAAKKAELEAKPYVGGWVSVTTRKYTISPVAQTKKNCQRAITKAAKSVNGREAKLNVDAARVYIEVGDPKNALRVLRKKKSTRVVYDALFDCLSKELTKKQKREAENGKED